jgi:hypothetical protein
MSLFPLNPDTHLNNLSQATKQANSTQLWFDFRSGAPDYHLLPCKTQALSPGYSLAIPL